MAMKFQRTETALIGYISEGSLQLDAVYCAFKKLNKKNFNTEDLHRKST